MAVSPTSHGRPVARLVPMEHPGPADPAEVLKRLRFQRWLRAGDGQPLLSDLMLKDRE